MIGKTKLLTPRRIATCSCMKMASLRAHNTGVTLWKRDEAGITITLGKAFLRPPATMNTVDITEVLY